ncbi:MAG: endonuclease/exonuclease/phosphatase family protein [Spirochaetota bacterium]
MSLAIALSILLTVLCFFAERQWEISYHSRYIIKSDDIQPNVSYLLDSDNVNILNGNIMRLSKWKNRFSILTTIIVKYNPEIITVQEAELDQCNDIIKKFPGYSFTGSGRYGRNEGDGCFIFFQKKRFHLIDSGVFWLSSTPHEPSITWDHKWSGMPRNVSWGILGDRKGRTLFVICTHFDGDSVVQQKSMKLILQKLSINSPAGPVILAGDFNTGKTSKTYDMALTRFYDPWEKLGSLDFNKPTYHAFNGIRVREGENIDWILLSKQPPITKPLEAKIIRDSEGEQYPSDHFLTYVKFIFH